MRERKGFLAEQLFVTEAIKNGLSISRPLNPKSRYDFVAELHGNLYKMQVKSTNSEPYTLKNQGYQVHMKPKEGYNAVDVDFFVVYIFLANRFYLIPFEKIPRRKKNIFIRTLSPECQWLSYFNNWKLLR
jgi:penicillin-binding protein-related factor A (putative recombinase)